jgi:2'-hydroxyisoflavone reductase
MKILFIGGTRFVGLAMAEEALRRGHEITLFHRGGAGVAVLPQAAHCHGDRNADPSALRGLLGEGPWDAVIDVCAYRPGEVDTLAQALDGRAERCVFVSTIAVYDGDIAMHCREGAALRDVSPLAGRDLATMPIDADSYGALKVLCERAALRHWPEALIIRPTYVLGPNDPTGRYPAWVQRLAAGGEVPVPGPADAPFQWIDARDLAALTLAALEADATGPVHVAGPVPDATWGGMLQATADAVAPPGTTLRWLGPDAALADAAARGRTVGEAWPLWGQGHPSALMALDPAAAIALGLRCRPLAETARDTLAWCEAQRDAGS